MEQGPKGREMERLEGGLVDPAIPYNILEAISLQEGWGSQHSHTLFRSHGI